jgi:hypothetical protein
MPLVSPHSASLRGIAERLKLPTVQQIARQPGISAVYRITIRYHDRRAHDSVATLKSLVGVHATVPLEIAYELAIGKPLHYPVLQSRYEAFATALISVGFDRMADPSDLPLYETVDLWMVERASGIFSHNVLLAPAIARDPHLRLVNAITNGLPESVRMIT